MNTNNLSQVLKGLIEISNEIDLKNVEIDDCDDSISLALNDNGKIKRFLIEVREV